MTEDPLHPGPAAGYAARRPAKGERGIPEGAFRFDISADYNHNTIPRCLLRESHLPPEVWGRLRVVHGEVDVVFSPPRKMQRATPARPAVIPPLTPFKLARTEQPVDFYLEYFHEPRLADPETLAAHLGD